ncbi:ABC transporter permease [Anaerotruncus rubiinfantis]|uniref:ABC transporter permease n=1 Tax=Anaerotruncus rubiinfantis TaxID=1720200 RepID=UPI00189B0354|nr:ABC transporter permease [Anaerotruncus rubiinfantis]
MSGSGTALPNIKQKITLGEFLRRYNIVVTFLAMMLVAVIATKGSFFTGDNMLNVVERASIIGLVALGQGIVILTGGIDLSVNAVMDISFTSIAVLVYGGMSYSMAIVVALLIGGVVGLVNGLLVIKTKIPAWLITLSTMLIVNAIALWWSGTTEIRFGGLQDFINNLFGMDAATSRFFSGGVWILFGLLFAVLLGKTRFGLDIFFVGGGVRAAYLSGVRTDFVKVMVYVISGLMAALAGIVLAYRVGSLNPASAEAYQLYSIAAVVLGGANINGGEGSAFGTFFGAVVLAILTNVLNIMQVNIYIQNAIMGLLLVLIVFVISVLSKRK